mmetsp:Transcript_27653/g.38610  ORF Transcript_27653/g.38610 Transcript_27653/m.38610 type:complete len:111 (-) Transcript_27653:945-1277(-)
MRCREMRDHISFACNEWNECRKTNSSFISFMPNDYWHYILWKIHYANSLYSIRIFIMYYNSHIFFQKIPQAVKYVKIIVLLHYMVDKTIYYNIHRSSISKSELNQEINLH